MALVRALEEEEMEPALRSEVQFFKGPLGVVPSSVRTMAPSSQWARRRSITAGVTPLGTSAPARA